jgi:hypothetical protein
VCYFNGGGCEGVCGRRRGNFTVTSAENHLLQCISQNNFYAEAFFTGVVANFNCE